MASQSSSFKKKTSSFVKAGAVTAEKSATLQQVGEFISLST
jgi:hypothetical protein